jgi:hypothetical protein
MPWTIYCHIHKDTGRRYIGLTKKTWRQRWNQHIYTAKSAKSGRSHFVNALRKYGKDAFDHEVLEVHGTLEEANEAEARWIEHFDSTNPEKGFNLAKGGEHVPHSIRKNPWDDPEFRKKCTKASRRTWVDSARRAAMSATMKTKCEDPKHLAGMSFRAKQQWDSPESRSRRMVAAKKKAENPEFRARCKNNWSNPDYRSRCSVALKLRNAREAAKTHCKNGHEYTEENTIRTKKGRECRTCHNLRKVARKTHCPNGHELCPENVYLNKRGARLCKVCRSRPKPRD